MFEVDVLVTGAIGLVSSIISAWTSWFFARKKYNSEVDNNLIKNMQESLDFYRQLSDDNKARLEEVLKRNDALEKRDEALEMEVRQLKNQMINILGQVCYNFQCTLRERDMSLWKKDFKNNEETIRKEQKL